jgi:paraquat-inducible protein A
MSKFWICETCDLIVKSQEGSEGSKFYCPRCNSLLHIKRSNIVNALLMLTFSALILYYPAFFQPIMKLTVAGMSSLGAVGDSYVGFKEEGRPLLTLIVYATAVFIPFILPLFLFLVTLFNKLKILPKQQRLLLKIFIHLKDWGMTEVFLLGILISIIKMHSMAAITFLSGLYIFLFYTIINILILSYLDKETLWDEIEKQLNDGEIKDTLEDIDINNLKETGLDSNLMLCETCGKILPNNGTHHELECPRCLSNVHFRKPNSLNRALALLIVSAIFLVPANILPIMEVKFLGASSFSTIMDGIIYFFHAKEFGIGAVIFIASVLVPLYKVMVILIIIFSIKLKRPIYVNAKTKLFKSIEFIGKWSMLDIFVIALMTVFIRFGELSTTYAADAAIYFALVVIATMTAGHFLDIRMLWDSLEEEKNQNTGAHK